MNEVFCSCAPLTFPAPGDFPKTLNPFIQVHLNGHPVAGVYAAQSGPDGWVAWLKTVIGNGTMSVDVCPVCHDFIRELLHGDVTYVQKVS